MNKITFPLKSRMTGSTVADLQDALQQILERGVILRDDEDTRRELTATLQRERAEQTYGKATSKLVSVFQEARQLQASGAVDEPTANALNALLKEWGVLEESGTGEVFVVRGRVVSHELRGVAKQRVVVVDKNIGKDVLLGRGETGDRGVYEISDSIKPLRQGKEKPDLQVQVVDAEGLVLAVSKVRYNAGPVEHGLDIVIPEGKLPRPAEYPRLIGELGLQLDVRGEAALKKRLGALKEDERQQDITYLANKTGWDARMVAMMALASQYSEKSHIEPEFYYALFRAGVPANEAVLSQMAPETVRQSWEKAIEQNILPSALKEKIADSLERFKAHSAARLLEGSAQIGISGLRTCSKSFE